MSDFDDDIDDFEDDAPVKPGNSVSRLRMALARWWMILIFAVLGYVVALYTLSIAEPSHEANAVLEVITKQRQLVGAELENDKLAVDKTMSTIASKLVGPGQLTKVVNSPKIQAIEKAVPPPFSLKPKYWRSEDELRYKSAAEADTSDIVKMITGNLKVTPRQGTTLIDINVTHKDSRTAITIADSIMEAYLETEAERKTGGATEAFKVLRGEANAAASDLETAQRSYESYKSVMVTNEQLKTKRDELVMLKQRYKARHPKMIQATAMHEGLKQRFRREISMMLQNPSELDFWSQHREQMDQYQKIIEEANAPVLVKPSKEVPKPKEAATKEEKDTPVLPEAPVQPVEQSQKTKELEEAEENWLALVQSALSSRAGFLQGRIANKQALYDTVTKRITEIDVAEENSDGEIKISERAYPSGNVETDKYLRLGQGLFGGALLGFGIAYLLGMVDYKIYDVRTVEDATGLPCLAAIPDGVVFDLDNEWENVLTAEPNTANAEAIRNLRAAIMLLGKSERHKTILITSAVPGEGKTTIASELAAAFALNEQKTVLVDLDLRKPRVHTLFPKLNKDLGMAEVLAGQADLAKVVQKTNVDGLHVICAGTKAPNPSELLQENELDSIITKLSEYYDRVIIDTPPILPVSDTRLFVRHVQTVILVVRALKAPVGAIIRAKELLEQAKSPTAGTVINAIKRKHGGSSYYGYKGYGEYGGLGGYGGYYDDEDEKKS